MAQNEFDRFRPVPFYFLNTTDRAAYTPQAVNEAMAKMKSLGYGGIVLFNKPPTGFDEKSYLSEEFFELTAHFIHAARALDMQLWINDGFNYPPGDAAGRIKAVAPELKQLRLYPHADGKLDIREVEWGFPAFEDPRSSELFIQFVYEEYYRRFAPYFGNGITGFFSDADNRRFNAAIARQMPEKYYPWSKNFPEIFCSRFHYRIEENLSRLFSDLPDQVKSDYWLLCGELYQQWFANNHAWCRAHNVLYTFHTSDTGPLNYSCCRRSSLFTEGRPLDLLAHADYPGTDHEIYALDGGTHYDDRLFTPKVSRGGDNADIINPDRNNTLWDTRAKYAASAAILNGRKRVMCEMFAATNWGANFNDLRRIAAWQIIQGVNFIVPHAVHHRFTGATKLFAPPEFSHSNLQYGVKEFNDTLTRWCQAASAGEYLADYAVIDPTAKVWNNRSSEPFFHFCDQLNRRADGYIIVPENFSGNIANIVDPLQHLPELPPPAVTFSGGELAYMRRRENGVDFLLAANVWQEKTLSGTLNFNGKKYELELAPGEIAILGGRFESYRTPQTSRLVRRLTGELPVVWEKPNTIAFDRELVLTASTALQTRLLLPADYSGTVVCNGETIVCRTPCNVFDDRYLDGVITLTPGENRIALSEKTEFFTPALLEGEFDVNMQSSGAYAEHVYTTYWLKIFAPEKYSLTLTPRRRQISTSCGWEKQGQLFYSGSALLDLGEINCRPGEKLVLPDFAGIAELLVNGISSGCSGLSPYRFPLPAGKNHLQLHLWNSMANRFERYAAPSGLSTPPEIRS